MARGRFFFLFIGEVLPLFVGILIKDVVFVLLLMGLILDYCMLSQDHLSFVPPLKSRTGGRSLNLVMSDQALDLHWQGKITLSF